MKKIGIIGAMSIEIEMILSKMTDKEQVKIHDMSFCTGKLEGRDVVLTSCSIGKVNAAIITQIMIDKFVPDGIINTGIAGSFDPNVKHLDVVISDSVAYHDVRKKQMTDWYPNQPQFMADSSMVRAASKAAEQCHLGLILTGDDFIDTVEKKEKIRENHSGLCVEMEGAAIAHTCFVNRVPFVIIRAISDLADGAAEDDGAMFGIQAANKSAVIVEKMMRLLP